MAGLRNWVWGHVVPTACDLAAATTLCGLDEVVMTNGAIKLILVMTHIRC